MRSEAGGSRWACAAGPRPQRSRRDATTRRSRLAAAAILTAAAAVALGGRVPLARAASLRVGQPAPEAVLSTLDGRRLSTTDLRGRVVIVTFWATWCVPCREELPLLSDYAHVHADRLTVLAFSLDDPSDLDQVRSVAKTLDFPIGLLGSDRLPGYGRIWRLPVSFTIDVRGVLVDNGWQDRQPVWTRESLERIVTPLLTPAAAARPTAAAPARTPPPAVRPG